MSTDTSTFAFHRSFKLSKDQLWHLLTDGHMREKWGAPSEGTVLQMITSDLRTGGIEHHICGAKEAPEFEVETRWYRLDGPTDAAFTETVEIGGAAIATTLVTYRVSLLRLGVFLWKVMTLKWPAKLLRRIEAVHMIMGNGIAAGIRHEHQVSSERRDSGAD